MTTVKADGTVEFRFFRPGAHRVSVAGDFNGWRGDLQMQPVGNGWWLATHRLAAGEYRFRYIADGTWFTDYAAHGVEFAGGAWNGVLVVPARVVKLEINKKTVEALRA